MATRACYLQFIEDKALCALTTTPQEAAGQSPGIWTLVVDRPSILLSIGKSKQISLRTFESLKTNVALTS